MFRKQLLACASLMLMAAPVAANPVVVVTDNNVITVDAKKPGADVQPTMYGIFFEDINYAADGGLYGEMVKNRSFEFPGFFTGWTRFGHVEFKNDGPFDKNPHYVRLMSSDHNDKYSGLENEGYFGMGFEKGADYNFSVWARSGGREVTIIVQLVDVSSMEESQILGEQKITINSREWEKYKTTIKAGRTVSKGRLRVILDRGDRKAVDLEHISLFPADVFNGDENGMRKDLAQALADLHPGVFRFPGGCIVEGTDLKTRYQWKNTVGPVENRPLNENRWHYTFLHRLFPDYYQSYGLGFYEYFRLAEEIGAEPLPVLSCGLSCQFQNGSQRGPAHVDVANLQPYIDDAIDLIEFANGDPSKNVWAKVRADMGHPAPFNLKFIAIGNEQWDEIYCENLEPFIKQIREKHPEIKIIGTSGPNSEGKDFDYLWPRMRELNADLVDEHFYRPESWFLAQGNRYDSYPRTGPKVFAGEYACHGRGKKYNHFNAALLEAAFMTGMERNADVVHMATYAPLFAHIDGWQWRPDMIWYDNLRSFKSCSYYVQQMFSRNKGSNVLSLTMNGKPVAGNNDQDGLFASAVFDTTAKAVIVKIVNTGDKAQDVKLNFEGMSGTHPAELTTFHASDLVGENTLDEPEKYVPQTSSVTLDASNCNISVPAKTFVMYKIQ